MFRLAGARISAKADSRVNREIHGGVGGGEVRLKFGLFVNIYIVRMVLGCLLRRRRLRRVDSIIITV